MRSRTIREGSVGLLIILGIGLFVSLLLWLQGWQLGSRTYNLEVELADALGIDRGSSVRYRGVKVGNVKSINPTANGVILGVEIDSAKLLIPRDVVVEVSQAGFIGQVSLDFRPRNSLSLGALTEELGPFDANCDPKLILCDGDRLRGQVGVSFDELIRATTQIATLLDNSELITNANSALKNLSVAAVRVNQLSKNANSTLKNVSTAAIGVGQLTQEGRQQLKSVGSAADSVTRAANQVGTLGNQFGTTANRVSYAADQVSSLVQVNRGTLISTLANLNQASDELKVAVKGLSPIISRVEKGKLLDNLETLAANGAQASATLRDFSATLNNPTVLIGLAQTLDSARVTFQNTQKITTDLDQLTGDSTFRANLRKLINGLSKLVSSSQDLEKQLQAVRSTGAATTPDQTVDQSSADNKIGHPSTNIKSD
jgi:phospholipid/cholesterol/gamma-HCH transport system substrate-binding protein